MVTKILVERDIDAGRALIEELDRQQIPVSAALWLYDDGDERYRLTIATSIYDSGPLNAYGAVRRVLDGLAPKTHVSLSDINVVSPNEPIVKAIQKTVKTGPGIGGVRFARNTINGIYIEDAWIYRSN